MSQKIINPDQVAIPVEEAALWEHMRYYHAGAKSAATKKQIAKEMNESGIPWARKWTTRRVEAAVEQDRKRKQPMCSNSSGYFVPESIGEFTRAVVASRKRLDHIRETVESQEAALDAWCRREEAQAAREAMALVGQQVLPFARTS